MTNQLLFWPPRIISLLFVVFVSLFAFDVFEQAQGWAVALALLIHLLPSFLLLGIVFLAWRHDLFGAIAFLSLAIIYVLSVGFDRPWSWYATIAGPCLVVSLLFFISWYNHRTQVN